MEFLGGLFEKTDNINNLFTIATGTIKENYDERFPGKVKVEISMTDGSRNVTDWIRVAMPYGGKYKGMYFMPDISDEVVVAFERGNKEKPIVIGVLWNEENTIPGNSADEDNNIKKIKTRGGHEIIFDDTRDKEKIKIRTPKKSEICIDDEESKITITAKGSEGDNIIKIDSKSGEITVTGKKKIVLEAGESTKISIDGDNGSVKIECDDMSIEASKELKIKGQNVSIEGTQVSINASGDLEMKSDGSTEINGTMVKIN